MARMQERHTSVDRFYELIRRLSLSVGGRRRLADCVRGQIRAVRGVYFFFEAGEMRPGRADGPRVVRVGTHGLRIGSKSTLYGRLSQHRGSYSGRGNHRGSVFRLHIGNALIRREGMQCASWAKGSSAPPEVRTDERAIEEMVSRYLGDMEVLWLDVPDEPGPSSLRGFIERNAIGLLAGQEVASPNWLGRLSGNASIVRSGLWNVNHVDAEPEAGFLSIFESLISTQRRP